ncbi:MAG: VWA domain-containing protein [Dehalococcoidia bacterium]
MELGYPFALALLLLVVPVVYAGFSRPVQAIPVPSLASIRLSHPTLRQRLARWSPLLLGLAAVLLVVALARPRTGVADAVSEAEGIDIALLLDASSSMDTTELGDGTRLEVAKQVIADFIEGRPDDRIGVVVFQKYALTLSPLTLDHGALAESVESVTSGLIPDGTGIGVGLAEALNLLRESTATSRVVILLTDGNHNQDSISPEDASGLAAAMKIRVYTIGLKAENPNFLLANEVDAERLTAIAELTGGRYFSAVSASGLSAVYDEIGMLETSRLGRRGFLEYREYGPWLALIAGLLILADVTARFTVLRRVPA